MEFRTLANHIEEVLRSEALITHEDIHEECMLDRVRVAQRYLHLRDRENLTDRQALIQAKVEWLERILSERLDSGILAKEIVASKEAV